MKRLIARWITRWLSSRQNRWHQMASAGTMPPAPMLDCESVMRQLWDYLDGELTPERTTAIRAHLELCQRCYPQYEFERSFLDAVATSAPEHSNAERVRVKLLEALRAKGFSEA